MQQVVFLDQNKWIELAQARWSSSTEAGSLRALNEITDAVEKNKILVPLSASNIFETQKVNDPDRRRKLAEVQSVLSKGIVFHSGTYRLDKELRAFFENPDIVKVRNKFDQWFLSDCFLDAFSSPDVLDSYFQETRFLRTQIAKNPTGALYSYMVDLTEESRRQAIKNFSASSIILLEQVKNRRRRLTGESEAMYRRVYKTQLFIEHLDQIVAAASAAGITTNSVTGIEMKLAKQMLNKIPYFKVETELAIRFERQELKVSENDFRDMLNTSASLVYADISVLEKHFANLALQSGLKNTYRTSIFTKLSELRIAIEA